MKFTLKPYIVEPPICKIVYSCKVITGDRLDLCAVTVGDSHGVFDPITGNYEFYSTNMADFKPGAYTFEITGTVGPKSASATFVVTLVDPCPTTKLTINIPVSFVDQDYILRDPQIDRVWDPDTILTRNTLVDCGPITVKFINTNTDAAPDSNIF